ncbi:AAA family ATPase [Nocardia sp. SYP-A9097]|nr:AAA family ATPase [Nocardia sp. SYP-A9097]
MEPGWHVVIDRRPSTDRAGAFAIGPTGVYALVLTEITPAAERLQRIRTHAEDTFAGLVQGRSQYAPHMLELMLLMPTATVVDTSVGIRSVDESSIRRTLLETEVAMSRGRAQQLASTVAARAQRFELISTSDAPVAKVATTEDLFDPAQLQEGERDAALARPFEEWTTFLDPEQIGLVNRTFNGPARFSGPAGTGKSVVALHRMARFAKRNPGRMLFTSFVRTLPGYHSTSFQRLAPRVGDRAEFVGLHAWTTRFLNDRQVRFNLDDTSVDTAFNLAWTKARTQLAPIESDLRYWRDELNRVIKGRGITTLAEYQKIERSGRNRIRLDDDRRAAVWTLLYEPYQERLRDRHVDDFNDVIRKAITTLRSTPAEDPYGLVVVDEVQDFTLMELRLVHQIAGGRTDSQLLLVGDGQQQVYPGGWRLADAGIPIIGRGAVLRVNYRNREAIHQYAGRIDATNSVGDLDGEPGFVLRDTEVMLPGGRVVTRHLRRAEVNDALVQAVAESQRPHADLAVIALTKKEAKDYQEVLESAGIPTLSLEKHDGTAHELVKVGTVFRAKGMDFRSVFHLSVQSAKPREQLTAGERDRAELADRQTMVALSRARDFAWHGVIVD